MSLMFYDTLFRFRNNCQSTTNAWIIFSILFMIQFWYIGIRFLLHNPEFSAIRSDKHRASTFDDTDWNTMNAHKQSATATTNMDIHQKTTSHLGSQLNASYKPPSATQQQPSNKKQTASPNFSPQYVSNEPSPSPAFIPTMQQEQMGESEAYDPFPTIPSMPAPKPMQDEYYEEMETGPTADYNPFESDDDDDDDGNDNGDFVVVDEQKDNIPKVSISVIDSNQTLNSPTECMF